MTNSGVRRLWYFSNAVAKSSGPFSCALLGSRLADRLQLEHLLLAELDGTALPGEGHAPLKHKLDQMYRYLEKDDLASVRSVSVHPRRAYPRDARIQD
jgi:hypothetical protein